MKTLLTIKRNIGWAICLMLTMASLSGFSQQNVAGKVTSSEDGQGIPGVSIAVKGTSKGTTTDATGNYKISVPVNSIVSFSAVGFISQDVSVGKRSEVNLSMTTDIQSLNEVVVVGYGTQKKSQLTGAISSVTAKQITEMPITNLGQAIQGRIAGVDVAQSGSKPGAVPNILIRGRRSFNAGNNPLYVVDGIPMTGDRNELANNRPFDFASGI